MDGRGWNFGKLLFCKYKINIFFVHSLSNKQFLFCYLCVINLLKKKKKESFRRQIRKSNYKIITEERKSFNRFPRNELNFAPNRSVVAEFLQGEGPSWNAIVRMLRVRRGRILFPRRGTRLVTRRNPLKRVAPRSFPTTSSTTWPRVQPTLDFLPPSD